MKCKLLSYTPNAENLVATAAKLCYSSSNIEELAEKQTSDKVEKFINMLMSMGHESPIEHVNFTFGVEGVSRSLTHQLVRHRIASYSQQSQRYVNLKDNFDYIIPPEIKKNEQAKKLYIRQMMDMFEAYVEISRVLLKIKCLQYNEKNLNADLNEDCWIDDFVKFYGKKIYSQFEKQSIEDARYVLPNACETKIIFTMNARTLLNFLKHRCCDRAQWEIRELAKEMRTQLIEVCPTLFEKSGPSCLTGKCSEGVMSCGKPWKK